MPVSRPHHNRRNLGLRHNRSPGHAPNEGPYDAAMTSRWGRGFFRGAGDEEAARLAQAQMTAAFLDMDSRQTIAATSVNAADQFTPERGLRALWSPIEQRCFAAAAAYLAADEQPTGAPSSAPAPTQSLYERSTRQLVDAAREIDEFYNAHRGALEHAAALSAASPQLAQQAISAADQAVLNLQGASAIYAQYPSVRGAVAALDEALGSLAAAQDANRPAAVRDAAAEVRAQVEQLERILAEAPARDSEARRAVSSVTTRLEAVRTRAERLPPAYSALLREFNAASSADLVGNREASERHMADGSTALESARIAVDAGDPEGALVLATLARTHLADAEACVDSVTERLSVLRAVREDPAAKTAQVRFKLRDAQHLAVSRGLAAEWGSVLDAQVDRIDRIESALTGHHPDYWTFMVELEAVSAFIAKVVQRMRGQAETR